MGFTVIVRPSESGWAVEITVRMNRAETARLFCAGDFLVSWPGQEPVNSDRTPVSRTGMFVSEIAAKDRGVRLEYRDQRNAEGVADALRRQLEAAGLARDSTA